MTFSFTVECQEIRQIDFPTIEPTWNPADYAEYLQPTSLGPLDGEVKKLADSIIENKKTVLEKAEEDTTTWQHCWAEFFLPGYGWVTVDPADVRKAMLTDNIDLANPKTKKYREFFGAESIPTGWSLHKAAMCCSTHLKSAIPSIPSATPMPKWAAKPLIFIIPRALSTATVSRKNNQNAPGGFSLAGSTA